MKNPIKKKKKKSFLKDDQKKGGGGGCSNYKEKQYRLSRLIIYNNTHIKETVLHPNIWWRMRGIRPKLNLGLHAQLEHNAQVISTRV